jgi:hypothetical protein
MVNLKLAGVAGIIVIVLTIVAFILSITMFASGLGGILGLGVDSDTNLDDLGEQFNKAQKIQLIFTLFISLFTIFFLLGFIELGKRYDNKILKIVPWVMIGFAIIGVIFSIISIATWDNSKSMSLEPEMEGFMGSVEGRFNENPALAKIFAVAGVALLLPLIILMLIIAIATFVFFVKGLYELDKKGVKLAKTSGILEIIGIIIGLVGLVAVILQIIIFFKEADKSVNPQAPPQAPPVQQQAPPKVDENYMV